ncbi:hypothetical protein Kfla_5943 [Kribbella flavida DSM 17836]|uniref:TPM domain-containing protein n=1 Tax=Kribbella flavida (strain DSM 17836 / JCM 10339 / NBRC 14399) TaxID=479435 RepID=D2PRM9_KRIFD|nr:hypothetical protein [Kribbella flavida]ADB34947.1 hypothetical protein Kfla_5943 [Kribbella flavida DSM 17836]
MRLLAGLLLLTSSLTGAGDPSSVVQGWQSSPVYVDPSQRALVPDSEAQRLADRVEGHDPAIRIAVVPAASLASSGSREQAARAYVDKVVDLQREDGIYLVVFGGVITWGSAVGVDTPIARILTDELAKHSRSDPVGVMDGVLDQLDVPGSPGGDFPTWLLVLIVLVALAALGLGLRYGLRWWKRRPDEDEGPALYRPSYQVLPDEADTLAERQALAREDVTRFGEELDAADVRLDGVDTAADVQAAMDAYADAGRVVDGEPTDEQLREVRSTVEYGRWRLACAQALVAGTPKPARRALCFFDPAHGTSVTDWMFTPPGGKAREIPVCAACRARLSGGAR